MKFKNFVTALRMGIGSLATFAAGKVLIVSDTYANSSGDRAGVFADLRHSIASSGAIVGVWGQVQITAASGSYSNAVTGLYGEGLFNGNANSVFLIGCLGLANHFGGTGTISYAVSSYNQVWKGAGTITNSGQVYATDVPNANPDTGVTTGTVVNNIGFVCDLLVRGTTRNIQFLAASEFGTYANSGNFGFLQESTYKNLLSGPLELKRGLQCAIVPKTANYTAADADQTILVDTSGGQVTITLPAIASHVGRIYTIKRITATANNAIVDGNASETIDGATTQTLAAQYDAITIQANANGWHILFRT